MRRPLPDEVRALVDRRLSAEEFRALADAPMSAEELAEIRSLIAWFTRRYPTPAARLAYVRRKTAAWTRGD